MNIWFFNHYAVPTSLYPLARPYHFANHLQKKGHKVTIFAASSVHLSDKNLITDKSPMKAKKVDGIRYVFLKARNYEGNGLGRVLNFFDYTIRLFTQTGKFNPPDVIMATSVHPLTCVAGILLARKYRCRCVVEIADLWPLTLVEYGAMKEGQLVTRALYALEHWIYRKADAVIFTMFGGKEYIQDMGWEKDVDLDKIYYINNGVDLGIYRRQEREEILEDPDLDRKDTFKVMYTGSMGIANSVRDILDAAMLLREHKEIQFFLYGAGYQEEELKQYREEHQIDNVHFKGRVNKKYIPGILARGDLNILTAPSDRVSEYGMSMNKMFDYMASGKPTLSNVRTRNDLFVDNGCGMTIEAGSPEAMAEGVLEFYQMDREKYETYCENAKKTVREYDFGYLTDRLEQILAGK
ncbi:MAG: glycosyltransferase family 4 protein [Eubacteriales bacterium]|nr:glycosyltransferase family 4 protein [Eubacteriales bacterium]